MSERDSICASEEKPAERLIDGIRFRRIPGYSRYEVSEYGVVLSWKGKGSAESRRTPVTMTPYKRITTGYLYVRLVGDNGIQRLVAVHHCVLFAFIGPRPRGMEACHGPDRCKTNNHFENLRWDTRAENVRDNIRDGAYAKGEKQGRAKLTAERVLEIRSRAASGECLEAIAVEFGVSGSTIGSITTGVNWRHVGGPRTKRKRRIESRDEAGHPLTYSYSVADLQAHGPQPLTESEG